MGVRDFGLPAGAQTLFQTQHRLIDIRLLVVLDAPCLVEHLLAVVAREPGTRGVTLRRRERRPAVGQQRRAIVEPVIAVYLSTARSIEKERIHPLVAAAPMALEAKRIASRHVPDRADPRIEPRGAG